MNSEEIDSLKEQKSKHVLKSIVDNFGFKIVKFGRYKKTGKQLVGFKNNIDRICDQYGEKIVGRSWNEALGKLMSSKSFFVPTMLDAAYDVPTAVVSLYDNQYPLVEVKNQFFGMNSTELCIMLTLLGFDANAEL